MAKREVGLASGQVGGPAAFSHSSLPTAGSLHKPSEVVYPDASQRDNGEMVLTISIWSTAPLTLHRCGNGQERVNGLDKQHSQLTC